jgi:Tol biopolymer transport system component
VSVSDPRINPDGEKIAFVHSTVNHDEDKYNRHIWLVDTATGKLTQFTCRVGSDTYQRWSPEGDKLLFLSNGRQEDTAIHHQPQGGRGAADRGHCARALKIQSLAE